MRRSSLIAYLLLCAVGPAAAQTAARRPSRPAPPPTSAPAADPAPAPRTSLPAPARMTLTGLPRRFDAGPECRRQCGSTRLFCEANADDCAPAWESCLHRCSAPANSAAMQ